MSKDKKLAIKDDVRDLANELKSRMQVSEPKANSVSISFEANPFEELALEETGLDMKQVKKLQKTEQKFVEALALAAGETINEARESTADIHSGSTSVKIGGNVASVHYDTTRESGGDDSVIQYGEVFPTYRVQAASDKGGMASVKNHLANQAKKLFG